MRRGQFHCPVTRRNEESRPVLPRSSPRGPVAPLERAVGGVPRQHPLRLRRRYRLLNDAGLDYGTPARCAREEPRPQSSDAVSKAACAKTGQYIQEDPNRRMAGTSPFEVEDLQGTALPGS